MNRSIERLLIVVLGLSSQTIAGVSVAQDVGLPAPLDDRYCMTCHGAEGQGNVGIQAPRIAGMEAWYLQRQLENFRAGIRGVHVDDEQGLAMQPMAARLSDESIGGIVEWVGTFEYSPAEITLEGNVSRGRTTYQGCASCHGARGEGNQAFGAPALAGQNDWYLVTQLKNFKAGYRGTHADDSFGAIMVPMARTLSDEQAILNVVAFINTLGRD
jgi:cytochrome c553